MDFPTVEFSERERSNGSPDAATVERASELFATWGTVRLIGAFAPEFMSALADHYRRRYQLRLSGTTKEDLRPLFTPEMDGPFADDTYHSNPFFFPIVRHALGDDCVFGACGSVVSFPGAPAQFVHRDSASLFDDYAIDVRLPPYALTVIMPLVDANRETGSTRVWPGTHRVPSFEEAQRMPSESPDLAVGSALMTDSRTLHGGSANVSQKVRPVVYNAYHRSWYRDTGGYDERPPVHINPIAQLRLPPDKREFFRIPREESSIDRMQWTLKRITARAMQNQTLRAVKNALVRKRDA